MKILDFQATSHQEFSPFLSKVKVFGKMRSIENHYHAAKVFKLSNGKVFFPKDWKESKKLATVKNEQIAWKIGEFILPVRMNRIGYQVDDFGVQWYLLLWHKYFKQNPVKLEYIQQFNRFENPVKFPEKFPFSQTDIFFIIKQDGLNSLRLMATELWNLLDGEPIIEYDLLKIKYGIICHQVNNQGVMDELAKQIGERYPIMYEKYWQFLPTAKLGDVLVIPIDECLSIVNLFTQTEIGFSQPKTDMPSLRTCLLNLSNLQCDKPIYLPYQFGGSLGDGNWYKIRPLITCLNSAIICHK